MRAEKMNKSTSSINSIDSINAITLAAEEWFGIKTDPDDAKKLREYLRDAYGTDDAETLKKVFSSGEAAGFLTVNETYFFREPVHFTFLLDALPSYEKEINICCAAVAAGCEAYSIAMLIEAYNKNAKNPITYHIDAFDIDPKVIETARNGVYGPRVMREDGSCFRNIAEPYLEKMENGFRIKDSIKKNICFFVHNLMDSLPPEAYDIVFFRNAFIYCSPRHRERILSNLSAVLKENGLLFLGVSETAGVHHPCLEDKNREDKNGTVVFYFQKKVLQPGILPAVDDDTANSTVEIPPPDTFKVPEKRQRNGLCIDISVVGDIITDEEKAADITGRIQKSMEDNPAGMDGNELVAAVLHFLKLGDFSGAGNVLDYLETLDDFSDNDSANISANNSISAFLRGEYFFLQELFTEAELYYRISLSNNGAFWPAGYRLSSLSSAEELKKYRAEKALDGLKRGRDLQYEVLIGGFPPDYYKNVLLKQKAG